jgi:hypothetical protein
LDSAKAGAAESRDKSTGESEGQTEGESDATAVDLYFEPHDWSAVVRALEFAAAALPQPGDLRHGGRREESLKEADESAPRGFEGNGATVSYLPLPLDFDVPFSI